MASATNLLGLVNQLQNLEISFSKILMETAMKLSALTDLNVFVLVETQDGRRFAGKRHLCDAFMQGSLAFQGEDVEFEVNPSIFALQQRHHGQAEQQQQRRRQSSQHCQSPRGRRSDNDPTYPQRSPKRRNSSSVASSPAKRRRSDPPSEGADVVFEADGDECANEVLVNGSGDLLGSEKTGAGEHPVGLDMNSSDKAPCVQNGFKMDLEMGDSSDAALHNELLDEQTGELCASDALVPFAGSSFSQPGRRRRTGDDAVVEGAFESRNGVVGVFGVDDHSGKTAAEMDEDCEELNREVMESLPNTLLSKLEGLSQFRSGPNLIPGSTEFRLLNSILYEFGIHTRSFCPFDTALPAAKKFLYNNLDSLISLFPILDAIVHHGGKFPIGSRQITKLTYFREKTKKAFMKYVKTGPAVAAGAKDNAGAAAPGNEIQAIANDSFQANGSSSFDANEFESQRQTQFAHHRLELQDF